jgi:predicted DsbA family dithiol-disulfide isomerase
VIRLEVWSDIVCPFCYIGKRHLEAALGQFERRDRVEVVWKSFELDPNAERNSKGSVYEMLSKKYGKSVDWARQMTRQVAERAAEAGLKFNFDRAVLSNSFDGHRLSHLAAKHGLQDRMEERLFAAYFTESKDIGDRETLRQLGAEAGLDPEEVGKVLAGDAYASEVRRDEEEAHSLGVTGVPFFLFNRQYAVSGAQPVEAFTKALRSASED